MVLVLGIGNLLWADEGFGVRCVEELDRRWRLEGASREGGSPTLVSIVDGGTQGLYLVDHVGSAERLLVFDAIDWGDAPGTLRVLGHHEVPRVYAADKMSLHQAGLGDVLAAAQLLGRGPSEIVVVGVQYAVLDDYGGSLSPSVAAAVQPALALGLDRLARWGVTATPRTDERGALLPSSLERGRYEAERPDETTAPRLGDPRFTRSAP